MAALALTPTSAGMSAAGVQSIVIEVPNDKVGLVIGKGGCTIKELEQRSGARVQITPDSAWSGRSDPRPIKLEGNQQQLDWVKQLVAEKVNVAVESLASNQSFPGAPGTTSHTAAPGQPLVAAPLPGGQGVVINVPNDSVGLVIGKQGATIKSIEMQTGIKIQISKECPAGTPNMRPITLLGPPNTVEHAKALIQAKVSVIWVAMVAVTLLLDLT